MRLTFYALIPSLLDTSGHVYVYNQSVAEAAKRNGWRHIAFIPTSCSLPSLPKTWIKALVFNQNPQASFFWEKIVRPFFSNFWFFIYLFRKLKKRESSIVFIEYYTLPILAAVALAAFLIRPKISFWHVMRSSPSQLKMGGWVHLFLQILLEKGVGKKRVSLMTDSAPIARDIERAYRRQAQILPIPHTQPASSRPAFKDGVISCWWPGPPRREKGLEEIIRFSKRLEGKNLPIELILSERLKTDPRFQYSNIRWVSEVLSREDYSDWLHRAHFILLPYDSQIYGNRTSGIFAEAITSGAIPLVSDNNWMSYELERFDLRELVINWGQCEKKLSSLLHDTPLRNKLSLMQKAYGEFHSQENFAQTFSTCSMRRGIPKVVQKFFK